MIKTFLATALVAVALMVAPASANGVLLGTLTCNVEGGVGLILGSVRQAQCAYVEKGKKTKRYTATLSRLGIDVGIVGNKTLTWAVFGVDGKSNKGLRGTYTGVNAEASALVGVGANALIGGFDSGIVLNPVSVSTQTGLNVAAGVATLTLR